MPVLVQENPRRTRKERDAGVAEPVGVLIGKCGNQAKKIARYKNVSLAGMIHKTTTGTTAPNGIEIRTASTPARTAQR